MTLNGHGDLEPAESGKYLGAQCQAKCRGLGSQVSVLCSWYFVLGSPFFSYCR
jgi:hypothetical protein